MIGQLRRWARWLRPGLGLKRGALVLGAGILLISGGGGRRARVSPLASLDRLVLRLLSTLVPAGGSLPPLVVGLLLVFFGGVLVLFRLRGGPARVRRLA